MSTAPAPVTLLLARCAWCSTPDRIVLLREPQRVEWTGQDVDWTDGICPPCSSALERECDERERREAAA